MVSNRTVDCEQIMDVCKTALHYKLVHNIRSDPHCDACIKPLLNFYAVRNSTQLSDML